jgi:hypothetical protein
MEEDKKIEPEEIKGFNDGYLLAQYLPELAEQLTFSTGEDSQLPGFKKGVDHFNAKKFKERMPDWLKKDPFAKNDTNQEQRKSRDKGIEPDR